jgi:sulfur relay (sulfurtransferase) complex TusBCD TusD component (DsrE family)
MLKRKTKPQYFVIIDCETATAYECNMETTEPIVLNKIFFYKDTCFMGQRNTSPTNYEFCEFEIV